MNRNKSAMLIPKLLMWSLPISLIVWLLVGHTMTTEQSWIEQAQRFEFIETCPWPLIKADCWAILNENVH